MTWHAAIGFVLAMGLVLVNTASAADRPAGKVINVVVLTGGHDFDKKAYPKVFEGDDDIKVTFADQKDHSEIFEDISEWKYDVIVFYNMSQKISEKRRENFLKLCERGVGLVPTHHNLCAYQEWPEFNKIIGARYHAKAEQWEGQQRPGSTYKHDITMKIKVEADHPVVSGITDFEIYDEGYKGQWMDTSAKLLLSCQHEASDQRIAWVKTYRNSRVCTIQLGHGPEAFGNPNYRKLIAQAIRWTAGK